MRTAALSQMVAASPYENRHVRHPHPRQYGACNGGCAGSPNDRLRQQGIPAWVWQWLLRPYARGNGVAFEILRLEDLHPQPHDIPMDFVVTEAGIYRVRPTGLEPLSAETCAAETSIGQ